mmetsp:Transcript_32661/g.60886  ORF Transcript_32661/g.60886 Transcript_32661/m.60886 type:complete len:80 (+) Transcript_32661:771-1010(+)
MQGMLRWTLTCVGQHHARCECRAASHGHSAKTGQQWAHPENHPWTDGADDDMTLSLGPHGCCKNWVWDVSEHAMKSMML